MYPVRARVRLSNTLLLKCLFRKGTEKVWGKGAGLPAAASISALPRLGWTVAGQAGRRWRICAARWIRPSVCKRASLYPLYNRMRSSLYAVVNILPRTPCAAVQVRPIFVIDGALRASLRPLHRASSTASCLSLISERTATASASSTSRAVFRNVERRKL